VEFSGGSGLSRGPYKDFAEVGRFRPFTVRRREAKGFKVQRAQNTRRSWYFPSSRSRQHGLHVAASKPKILWFPSRHDGLNPQENAAPHEN